MYSLVYKPRIDNKVEVVEDYTFSSITVPKGYSSDGLTIPWLFRLAVNKFSPKYLPYGDSEVLFRYIGVASGDVFRVLSLYHVLVVLSRHIPLCHSRGHQQLFLFNPCQYIDRSGRDSSHHWNSGCAGVLDLYVPQNHHKSELVVTHQVVTHS